MELNLNPQKPEFRQEEVERLFGWIQASESASIIGISGIGKSNLFNHICDVESQRHYLAGEVAQTVIVRVNFHYAPDFSDRSIYSLILEQLELLEGHEDRLGLTAETLAEIGRLHEGLLDAGNDVLKVQRYFKLAVRALLARSQRRLVLLLDQFDEVYQEADAHLFANLRGLREAYKYRIAYFAFTRDLLPYLTEMDAAREEFYELLASNVLGLRPYTQDDALSLLDRVSERNQLPFVLPVARKLYRLTGGHGGLLRTAYLAVVRDGLVSSADERAMAAALLRAHAVEAECEKIWRSLSTREHKLLHALVNGRQPENSEPRTEWQLQLKGVLADGEKVELFAPIFRLYVKNQDALWEQPVYLDEAARQVWVLGHPAPPLTRLEYRLFHLLYERDGEVVVKDDLVHAGWPDAKGGVSDEALIAAIARLRRKVEPDPKNPRFLQNVHNQGYVLQVQTALH